MNTEELKGDTGRPVGDKKSSRVVAPTMTFIQNKLYDNVPKANLSKMLRL